MNASGQKLVVRCAFMSIDGFMAGVNQSFEQPFGEVAEGFQEWFFATRTGREMIGLDGGSEGVDNEYLSTAFDGTGATILGRNMFTASRGPWPDDGWTGWWGPNPPYHNDTYVLTHHPKASLPMEGGTTFHFVTSGIEDALDRAFASAKGQNVRLMGGATTISQYLRAGLVDEMHIVMVPKLNGAGSRLFDDAAIAANYRCTGCRAGESVTHLEFVRA